MEELLRIDVPGVPVAAAPESYGDVVFAPDSKSSVLAFGAEITRHYIGSPPVWISFAGHTAPVTCLSLSPAGSAKKLASGAEDASVRLWDAELGKQLEELYGHRQTVNAVSISPDEKLIASAGEDGRINVWTAVGGGSRVFEKSFGAAATDVTFTRDSRHLCVALAGGRVLAWEIQGSSFTQRLDVMHNDGVSNARTSLAQHGPPGMVLSGQNTAKGWSLDSGEMAFKTNPNWGRITKMRVAPDFRHIVCCYADTGSIMWWPIVNGAPQGGGNFGDGIVSFALSPNRCFIKVSKASSAGTYHVPTEVRGSCPAS